MRYNLAYGSNTNIEQMKTRCPKAKLVGTGAIDGWKLVFQRSASGFFLNIVPGNKNDWVPVVVWEMDDESERLMDICEGYPRCYHKQSFKLEVRNGKRGKNPYLECFAYVMPKGRPYGLPTDAYLERCSAGFRHFGFPQRILDEAYIYSNQRKTHGWKEYNWKQIK